MKKEFFFNKSNNRRCYEKIAIPFSIVSILTTPFAAPPPDQPPTHPGAELQTQKPATTPTALLQEGLETQAGILKQACLLSR